MLLLNALVALTLGSVVYPVAIVTGTKPQLCDALQGKYDPTAADQCKGGDWVRLVKFLPQPR